MDKNKNKNKTLIPKIISLLLSLGLWIYISNVENPVRTYEVKNIPVELVNLDSLANSKFAIGENQNFTVDLKLEGPSTEVIKVKPQDFKVIADMSTYALKVGENTIPVQVISYPENMTIKNNGFLGIKVNLEELVTKDFSLYSNVKLNYKDNIHEKNTGITPAKVTAQGPSSTIERINSAIITGEENNISSNMSKEYPIKFVDSKGNEVKGVTSNVDSAKLSVEVTNGKSVPISLKTTGIPKTGFELKGYELNTNYIDITGNSDILANIQAIDTETIDISSLNDSSELNVKLIIPDGVTVASGQDTVKVKVVLSHQQNITKDISVLVKYNNIKDDLILEKSPEKVNITVSGIQTELDKIDENVLQATLDLSMVTDEGAYSYKPEVSFTSPTTATISNIENVELTIVKKPQTE